MIKTNHELLLQNRKSSPTHDNTDRDIPSSEDEECGITFSAGTPGRESSLDDNGGGDNPR